VCAGTFGKGGKRGVRPKNRRVEKKRKRMDQEKKGKGGGGRSLKQKKGEKKK